MTTHKSTDDTSTKNMGKYFVWIAWCLGLLLLIFVFQDILDTQWNPNTQPKSFLSSEGQAEVHLQRNRHGHYITAGTINEEKVIFLLDTGATQVSIPEHIAERIDLPKLGQYPVETANGRVMVFKTRIEVLSIGNIFLYNVAAHINPGMKSDEILLGMSALKRIEFQQTGQQLILREPH